VPGPRRETCLPERRRRLIVSDEGAGVLITRLASVRHLTGFTGSSGVLWIPNPGLGGRPVLVTDSRYEEQAAREVDEEIGVAIASRGWPREMAKVIAGSVKIPSGRPAGLGEVEFDPNALLVSDFNTLEAALGPGFPLIPNGELTEDLRRTKDREEVRAISDAIVASEHALTELRASVDWSKRPAEAEVAARLVVLLRLGTGEAPAFEPIVASGPNSALPHHTPGSRRIRPGDLVLFDFGARVDGYRADIARTFLAAGDPEPWQEALHRAVLEANAAARSAAAAGEECREVDKSARNALDRHGLADRFGHSTGHGLGLEVHEPPSISRVSEQRLMPGDVVTIEPGAYLPGRGGVRIEDVLVIGSDRARSLSTLPRHLLPLQPEKRTT